MSSAEDEKYALAAQEDRSATRARLTIPANLRPSGGKSFQTVVRDLSLSGFSAAVIDRIPPGTICWLSLPDHEVMQAKVVWWNDSLVGCAFEQLLSPAVHDAILARWSGEKVYRG